MTETNAESREKFVRFLEVWAKLKKPLYSSIEKLPPVPQEHRELVLSYYKMTYGGVEIPINELVKKNFVWSSVEKEWAAKKGDKYEFSHHRFGFSLQVSKFCKENNISLASMDLSSLKPELLYALDLSSLNVKGIKLPSKICGLKINSFYGIDLSNTKLIKDQAIKDMGKLSYAEIYESCALRLNFQYLFCYEKRISSDGRTAIITYHNKWNDYQAYARIREDEEMLELKKEEVIELSKLKKLFIDLKGDVLDLEKELEEHKTSQKDEGKKTDEKLELIKQEISEIPMLTELVRDLKKEIEALKAAQKDDLKKDETTRFLGRRKSFSV